MYFKSRLLVFTLSVLSICSASFFIAPPFLGALAQDKPTSIGAQLNAAAIERASHQVVYDPSYQTLDYPGGDVAPDRGVCADVLIRAMRVVGIDLQKVVHEDMRRNFSRYPTHWGLATTDRNIDHRRVPNLEVYFTRHHRALTKSSDPADYLPGDIVAWNLRGDDGWLPHIGIVTDVITASGRPKIVHNIGSGPQLEDVLFDWKMTGHYRLAVADS